MPVIVNDFEVVAEPAPPVAEAAAEAGAQAPPAAPTPHDFEIINRRQQERAARVRAD